MTSPEEFTEINHDADAFMFTAYGPDTIVTMGTRSLSLGTIREYELEFRNPEELAADPQLKRAGIWARLLDGAGVLRDEHRDLLPHAGDYDRA